MAASRQPQQEVHNSVSTFKTQAAPPAIRHQTAEVLQALQPNTGRSRGPSLLQGWGYHWLRGQPLMQFYRVVVPTSQGWRLARRGSGAILFLPMLR